MKFSITIRENLENTHKRMADEGRPYDEGAENEDSIPADMVAQGESYEEVEIEVDLIDEDGKQFTGDPIKGIEDESFSDVYLADTDEDWTWEKLAENIPDGYEFTGDYEILEN